MLASECSTLRVFSKDDAKEWQRNINKLIARGRRWRMVLNIVICSFLRSARKKGTYCNSVWVTSYSVFTATPMKYLRVCLSSDLSWNGHLEYIITKGIRVIFLNEGGGVVVKGKKNKTKFWEASSQCKINTVVRKYSLHSGIRMHSPRPKYYKTRRQTWTS